MSRLPKLVTSELDAPYVDGDLWLEPPRFWCAGDFVPAAIVNQIVSIPDVLLAGVWPLERYAQLIEQCHVHGIDLFYTIAWSRWIARQAVADRADWEVIRVQHAGPHMFVQVRYLTVEGRAAWSLQQRGFNFTALNDDYQALMVPERRIYVRNRSTMSADEFVAQLSGLARMYVHKPTRLGTSNYFVIQLDHRQRLSQALTDIATYIIAHHFVIPAPPDKMALNEAGSHRLKWVASAIFRWPYHRAIVIDAVIALARLDLPAYVLLWIVDCLPYMRRVDEATKIGLIHRVIASIRRVRARRQ